MPLIYDIIKQKNAFRNLLFALLAGITWFLILNYSLAMLFNAGLREYYCLQPAQVLLIGHSMTEMGVDRTRLEEILKVPVAKYCMNGAGAQDRLIMLKHYLETVKKQPSLIIYDISARSFSDGLSTNSYALFFPFMDESPSVNQYVRSQASTFEYWQKKLLPLCRYDDTRLGAVWRGLRKDWSNHSLKQFSPELFIRNREQGKFWKIGFNQNEQDQLKETLQYLSQKKIQVILAALPSVDLLNQAEPEKYEQVFEIFQRLTKSYPGVTILDFNPEFSVHHELFGDPIHLNPAGQLTLTESLGNTLLKIAVLSHKKNELLP